MNVDLYWKGVLLLAIGIGLCKRSFGLTLGVAGVGLIAYAVIGSRPC